MKKKTGHIKVVALLILLVAIVGIGFRIIDRYIPSKTVLDGKEYFGVSGGEDAAVVLPDRLEQGKALVKDGTAYISYELAKESLNDHLYKNEEEKQVILTTATDIIKLPFDSAEYTTLTGNGSMPYQITFSENGNLYLALEYLVQYTDFQYTVEQEPLHIIINNQWGSKTYADVTKEESIRLDADIKSPILRKAAEGEKVTILEREDDWAKILTEDGYIGYIRSKRLGESYEEQVTNSSFQAAEYTSIHRDHKINLIWHQVTSQDSNAAFSEDMQDVTGVNVVSPTWFSISSNDGDLASLASEDYVSAAHEKGMEVWGLMDNFSTEIDTTTILGNTASRENLEGQLITEALNHGLDGINIDIETLPEEASESYVQFMRELSVKCRNNNLVLSVDVPPPYDFNTHYNRKALGEVVDYLMIMGYDEHYVGSEARSVASLSYERNGITGTLESVSKDKIISGIPFYTRLWKTNASGEVSSEAIGMDHADEILSQYQVTAAWSEETSQDYAEFTDEEGNFCQIWLENEKSIEEKMKLVQQYDLGGVAEWKLGFERTAIWDVIAKYM
jgi:spore germination protein YaaH